MSGEVPKRGPQDMLHGSRIKPEGIRLFAMCGAKFWFYTVFEKRLIGGTFVVSVVVAKATSI